MFFHYVDKLLPFPLVFYEFVTVPPLNVAFNTLDGSCLSIFYPISKYTFSFNENSNNFTYLSRFLKVSDIFFTLWYDSLVTKVLKIIVIFEFHSWISYCKALSSRFHELSKHINFVQFFLPTWLIIFIHIMHQFWINEMHVLVPQIPNY